MLACPCLGEGQSLTRQKIRSPTTHLVFSGQSLVFRGQSLNKINLGAMLSLTILSGDTVCVSAGTFVKQKAEQD